MATTTDSPRPTSVTAPVAIADPGPLGLSAFALTTFVLSAATAELMDKSVEAVVLGLTLFYGGAVQVIAGIWEFRKGNTFGATAFCSYGGFWLSYWWIVQFFLPGAKGVSANTIDTALGYYLLGWTVFTLIMLLASLRTNAGLVATFVALSITFILLTAGRFDHSATLATWGGWLGIITAACALFAAAAGVINETWKREVVPVFKL